MTNLFFASILFAACMLSFSLVYLALRRPNAGRWAENDLLASLICVALTAMVALSIAAFTAFGLTWEDEIALMGLPKALGLGLADLAALMVAVAIVRYGKKLAARGEVSADVVPLMPGTPQPPANRPKRPRRMAA